MKKQLLAIMALLSIVTSFNSFAGSGKAIVPHWNNLRSFIYISNITDNPIKVTVTYYGKNGGIQTGGITYTNFTNNNTELAANSSGNLKIDSSSSDYGYAVIQWSNLGSDNDAVALIAQGSQVTSNGTSWRSDFGIQINNGMPF